MHAFRKGLYFYMCASFTHGLKGRMWDLIVLFPDHCLPWDFT